MHRKRTAQFRASKKGKERKGKEAKGREAEEKEWARVLFTKPDPGSSSGEAHKKKTVNWSFGGDDVFANDTFSPPPQKKMVRQILCCGLLPQDGGGVTCDTTTYRFGHVLSFVCHLDSHLQLTQQQQQQLRERERECVCVCE